MKSFISICAALCLLQTRVYSQSGFTIEAATGIVTDVKNNPASDITEIRIVLPDKEFEKLHITINSLQFRFDCNEPTGCIRLFPRDIQRGIVLLRFKANVLTGISDRSVIGQKESLAQANKISFTETDNNKREFEFSLAASLSAKKNAGPDKSVLAVCKDTTGEMKTLSGLASFTFLCPDSLLKKECFCGIPVKNAFENMYLPPCFDKDGNAISVKYHVLYDMSQTDPLRKAFLFETQKSSLEKSKCPGVPYTSFEFASIRKKMRTREGFIMAVSAIAHKDSSVVIDSNQVNFFMDSAQAVQNAFTAAGNRTTTTGGQGNTEAYAPGKEENILKGAVTLQADLVYFNNYFRDGNFIQDVYLQQLICLQQNIARFFELPVIPKSGKELAEALDEKIKSLGDNLRPYYTFACQLLQQLITEYDSALHHVSNYRIYTQVMQVPNADELTVGIGTKTNNQVSYLYRHKFLVKGGMKLDFSTGVFVSGLDNQDFSIRSVRYTFRDSLTAPTRDTTGNLIDANKNKLNVNTGFLVHVYPRSGHYWNIGGVAGVTFNNSQFMFLVGGSAMFRMGNTRLSFVGGLAFGQQKELQASQAQYRVDENQYPLNKIYNQDNRPGQIVLADRLPRFLQDPNVQTYNKIKRSWFAGITYNFAGINLGK